VETAERLAAALGPACPEIADLIGRVPLSGLDKPIAQAAVRHLMEPTTTAANLAGTSGATVDQVRAVYRFLRADPAVQALVRSAFYPWRLAHRTGAAVVAEWLADPDRPRRLIAGEPVLSSTVEIHPSIGTCAYQCAMCLWSDKDELTYRRRGLTGAGLVGTRAWVEILGDLADRGVGTVVVSGGGEPLLNPCLADILGHARRLGLLVHVYTTGFNLPEEGPLWAELAAVERVRLSIHSPDPDTYSKLVGLPPRVRALERVSANIGRLRDHRERLGYSGSLGIGFVLQPLNYHEVESMAAYAAQLGVDFLDIRKDEVDVTAELSPIQRQQVLEQLRRVRAAAVSGAYGTMVVDLADELVTLVNGATASSRRRTDECRAKYFRPTISPYGLLAPCDLKAEPRFAGGGLDFGLVAPGRLDQLVATLTDRHVPDACEQCMPSSRTGNAMYAKLLADIRAGVPVADQPFAPMIAIPARSGTSPYRRKLAGDKPTIL
jgi:MoaA/NifB/PqqE/SkfB family radical SAM enzyme